MFNIFKRKIDNNIYTPVKGTCIDISDVKDQAFASGAMGDGVAIVPAEDVIKAPCDGTISMLFHTGHAFGLEANNGAEILVHIGIETVNLNGSGFMPLVQQGQQVKAGEAIIQIDLDKIKAEYDPTTILIITNQKPIKKTVTPRDVIDGEVILEVE